MSGWKDISSYSRSDTYPRTPRTWSLTLGGRGVELVVTRHRDLPPDAWAMHLRALHVDTHRLRAVTLEDAQREALTIARRMLAEALAACAAARGES